MSSTEPATRLHVGRASLEGNIERYAKSFNLVEVVGERGRHPKGAGLTAWRRAVPEDFAFSIVVPAAVAALAAESDELVTHAEKVADALDAAFWVLRTPPQVTPSARATRALSALCERLRSGKRRIAWEPRGVWSEETALETAQNLRVCLVRDLAREDRLDDEDVVYTRLRALGEGARIGAAAAERVAERLEGARDAYVIVEGEGAGRVRKVVSEAFAAEPLDDLDDEDDEGDEGDGDALDDEADGDARSEEE